MASVNCTIVGQKGRGSTSYGTAAAYMGRASGGTNYDYVLSFTTGDFSGKCKSVTFQIKMSNSALSGTKTYRWALLDSDANAVGTSTSINLYYNHYNDVTTDPNQIAKGTLAVTDANKDTHKTLTVEVDSLKPNTGYFLVMWPYSSAASQVTVSATQYHNPIVLEYDPVFSVELNHCLMDATGKPTWYSRTTYEVEAGASYTPTLITPPSTHTQKGATFKAWVIGWTSVVGEGVVGEDYFTVNEDLTIEVYYFSAGSFVYVNRNGEAVKCEVYVNRNGEAVRCDVYVNKNGTAVKM